MDNKGFVLEMIKRLLKFIVVFCACLTFCSVVIMCIWNNLLMGFFNLGKIGFWQALALVIFVRTLIGKPWVEVHRGDED
jgi:hypothetical protein